MIIIIQNKLLILVFATLGLNAIISCNFIHKNKIEVTRISELELQTELAAN